MFFNPIYRSILISCLALFIVFGRSANLSAKTYSTLKKALLTVFGDAKIERKSHFLTSYQKDRLKTVLGKDWEGEIAYSYQASDKNGLVGTAYLDKHQVRTLPETLMIVVGPDGAVTKLEVLTFYEPEEYKARPKWYEQFFGKKSPAKVKLKRDVQGITGATLTARAGSQAVQRILALHSVLASEKGS